MKIRKIILVFILSICILSSLALSVFADSSVVTTSGSVLATPYFSPSAITFINGNYRDCLAPNFKVALSASNNSNTNYGLVTSDFDGASQDNVFLNSLRITNIQNQKSSYGMTFYPGTYQGNAIYNRSGTTALSIYFEDIFVPAGLNSQASYDWSNLGTFVLDSITCESASLSVTYSYLSDKNNDVTYKEIVSASVPITASEALDSSLWMPKIKDKLRSGLSWSDYKNGFYIRSINLRLNNCSDYNQFSYSGNVKFTSGSGSDLALRAWSGYYVPDIIQSGGSSNPTVIESTIRGLNAVWNLELFGAFKVGTLFTAVMTILLFRWFLKLFAGG